MKLRGRGGERRSMRKGREGVKNGPWAEEREREGEDGKARSEREEEREREREGEAVGVERGKQRSM